MPKIKLTDAAVQRLKAPQGGRIDYFDASYRGFGIRVSGPPITRPPNDPCRKSWFLFYRFRGKQKRLTFEPAYPALSLADARKRAGEALTLLPGADPAQKLADTRTHRGDTIAEIAANFIASAKTKRGRSWSARYKAELKRNLDNHVLPRWGERDVRDITRRDVNELLDAVASEGTTVRSDDGKRHVPGGGVAANRVLSNVRALLNWAVRQGIIDSAPVSGIDPRTEEIPRDRTLAEDEIRHLWPQFEKAAYPFGHVFKLALATAQRRDEVAGMRLNEINEDKMVWEIPSARTKSGRPHVVPLNALARLIITDAKENAAKIARAKGLPLGPYFFTTTVRTPISGYSRAKAKLDKDAMTARAEAQKSPIERWTIHDLRRTAATRMAELGISRFIISRVLNHSDKGVTGIYDRYDYLEEKKHALDVWSRGLIAAISGDALANVVLMDRRHVRQGVI